MSSASKPPEGLRTTSDPKEGATRIVLVRHGQGEVNVTGVIGGAVGCTGLTNLGRQQVGAMASRLSASGELSADVVYASTLPRAIETAQIIAPSVGRTVEEIQFDCALCELHPGAADGLVWEKYVASLVDRHEGKVVVVGTHAGFIEATILRYLVGSPEGSAHPRLRLRTAHASLTEWEHSDEGWRLLRYNDAFVDA